jgi:hypothetical protein
MSSEPFSTRSSLAEKLARHHVEAALENLLVVLNVAESTDLNRRMS